MGGCKSFYRRFQLRGSADSVKTKTRLAYVRELFRRELCLLRRRMFMGPSDYAARLVRVLVSVFMGACRGFNGVSHSCLLSMVFRILAFCRYTVDSCLTKDLGFDLRPQEQGHLTDSPIHLLQMVLLVCPQLRSTITLQPPITGMLSGCFDTLERQIVQLQNRKLHCAAVKCTLSRLRSQRRDVNCASDV